MSAKEAERQLDDALTRVLRAERVLRQMRKWLRYAYEMSKQYDGNLTAKSVAYSDALDELTRLQKAEGKR